MICRLDDIDMDADHTEQACTVHRLEQINDSTT